jgi:hypothetical protein
MVEWANDRPATSVSAAKPAPTPDSIPTVAADHFATLTTPLGFTIVVGRNKIALGDNDMPNIVGVDWSVALQISPISMLRLYESLATVIKGYQEQMGQIPRPAQPGGMPEGVKAN